MRKDFRIVLVTAPDLKTARRLAQAALKNRLAACANLVPNLESRYWWQGKLETSREVLVIFKTRRPLLKKLERQVIAHHPYDTPECIVLAVAGGAKRYLKWIISETSVTDPE